MCIRDRFTALLIWLSSVNLFPLSYFLRVEKSNCFPPFTIVNEDYSTCVFGLTSLVVDQILLTVMNRRKNLVGLCKLSAKQSCRQCFWSSVGKCSIHLMHSFVIYRFLCKVLCTHSVISLDFILRCVNAILWIFLIFSGVVTSMGRQHMGCQMCCLLYTSRCV